MKKTGSAFIKLLTKGVLVLFGVLWPGQLSAAGAPAAARFEIRVDSSYPASLFYLIDNLSGAPAPGKKTMPYYRAFWEKEFGFSAEDEKLLAGYAAIRGAYQPDIRSSDNKPVDKWPLLFIGGSSLEDAWEKADLYLADKDVAELRGIFAHFDVKFRPYWDLHAGNLARAAADFKNNGWQDRTTGFLEQAARFYELDPSLKRSYVLTLLWHPGAKTTHSQSGTRLGRLMLVELPEEQGIAEKMDVVVHEFLHDLFGNIPPEARRRMIVRMQKSSPWAVPVFLQNMNEGFATALGNGLFVARYLPEQFKPDGNWYAAEIVDSFAKAVYPAARKAMEQGGTLSGCGPLWGAAVKKLAAGAKLPDQFKSQILIFDSQALPLSRLFIDSVDANDVHTFPSAEGNEDTDRILQLMAKDPARPVVLMGEPDYLLKYLPRISRGDVAARQIAGLKEKAKRGGLAALIRARSGRPFFFLLGSRESIEPALAGLKDLDCCSSDFSVLLKE